MISKIAVVGSINMDFVVQTDRIPVQGETLLGKEISYLPGGKGANQAVAASRLGAEARMIGSVGKDLYGKELISCLSSNGVEVSSIKEIEGLSTGTAIILLANGENSIIVIQGANEKCLPEDIDRNIDVLMESDIVLIQMEIPMETVCHTVKIANLLNKTVILNPAPAQHIPEDIMACVDIITPNETELDILTSNWAVGNALESKMDALLSRGVRNVITTLGSEGVAYKGDGQSFQRIPSYKVPVKDTTGAGDAFNAGLAYAIGQGKTILDSIEFANKTAALAIGKSGALLGMPSLTEVLSFQEKG
ncbi:MULTISPECIES: ribokinase [unclassified Bacillus (in: firmicutes)]|uniref:ribokinase n=1 Tax=unclassified Bacillus (in: firmicutes) TaxID=185979 RepID=UPI003000EA1C